MAIDQLDDACPAGPHRPHGLGWLHAASSPSLNPQVNGQDHRAIGVPLAGASSGNQQPPTGTCISPPQAQRGLANADANNGPGQARMRLESSTVCAPSKQAKTYGQGRRWTYLILLRIRRSPRRTEGARALAGLRSRDGPLSVRVRPSSLKRDRARRTTSTGNVPGARTREVTLDPGDHCGHSGLKTRATREPARTGRGPSPTPCGRSPGCFHGRNSRGTRPAAECNARAASNGDSNSSSHQLPPTTGD
jgi:hypothetical protein